MNDTELINRLRAGEVAILPTDTVYGLATRPGNVEAIKKIYRIKARPIDMNLPVMVHSPNALTGLGLDINENADKLLRSPWMPGPLTLILGFRSDRRADWLQGRDEVAVRIPANEWLLKILSQVGPLLVTSANKHGNKNSMGKVAEILEEIEEMPDIVINHGDLSNVASSIVNCRGNTIFLERQGQVNVEEITKWITNG